MFTRVAIIGNTGSGKSFLARELQKRYQVPCLKLDDIFWSGSSYNVKRPLDEVETLLNEFSSQENWIIEGVYGEFMEMIFEKTSIFIWLDIEWKICKESLLQRAEQQQNRSANFHELLDYASKYWERNNKRSFIFHQNLFESFKGEKYRFVNRLEVNEFLNPKS